MANLLVVSIPVTVYVDADEWAEKLCLREHQVPLSIAQEVPELIDAHLAELVMQGYLNDYSVGRR